MKTLFRSIGTVSVILLVSGLTNRTARGDLVVVPNSRATTEGNDSNFGPFFNSSVRYQQVYGASEFASSDPLVITQIAFRPDGSVGTAELKILPSALRIKLSTTSQTPGSLSSTFADNIGTDESLVFSTSAFFVDAPVTGPVGGPKDFTIVFELDSPFTYDPSKGNLLLDFTCSTLGVSASFDAENGSPSTAHVDAANSSATIGDVAPNGLVTRFQFCRLTPPTTSPSCCCAKHRSRCLISFVRTPSCRARSYGYRNRRFCLR